MGRRGRGRRGRGTVFYDNGRGCWTGQLSLGRGEDGKRKRGPKAHAATEGECWELLDKQRDELRGTGQVARRDTTVTMVVRDMLDHPPASWKSAGTLEANTGHAKRIVAAFGTVKLARLTVGQVDALLRKMAAGGYSKATISGTRSLLVRAIRRAERDGLVSRNVATLAEMPVASTRVSKAMTTAEVGRLLKLDLSAWWRAFIVMAVMLGLRPGEMLGLRWEDIDLDGGVLRVRKPLKRDKAVRGRAGLKHGDLKTPQSKRTLRLPAAVRAALAALRREQVAARLRLGGAYADSGLVFCDSAGRPVWPQHALRQFKALCVKAGLGPDWQLRELRHTFVSQMSEAGIGLEVIADHAGHKDSTVTRAVYRHLLADEIGTAAVVFDHLYGGASQ